MRTAMIALCLLAAACGQDHGPATYQGSEFVRVHLLSFTPEHSQMVGKTATTVDAAVTLIRKGTQPYAVSLPGSCPTLPITTRMGREIMMRQDIIRYADGSSRGVIPRDEAIAALCREIGDRIPPPGA
jgi:hypothetical protein